jgi:hypothetical protein
MIFLKRVCLLVWIFFRFPFLFLYLYLFLSLSLSFSLFLFFLPFFLPFSFPFLFFLFFASLFFYAWINRLDRHKYRPKFSENYAFAFTFPLPFSSPFSSFFLPCNFITSFCVFVDWTVTNIRRKFFENYAFDVGFEPLNPLRWYSQNFSRMVSLKVNNSFYYFYFILIFFNFFILFLVAPKKKKKFHFVCFFVESRIQIPKIYLRKPVRNFKERCTVRTGLKSKSTNLHQGIFNFFSGKIVYFIAFFREP